MVGNFDAFNFYLKFIKPLVLNLRDPKDRATAALWLKKLRETHNENPKNDLQVEYLKLLLFASQRNKLTGIFEKPPPEGPLERYPGMNTAIDMIPLTKPSRNRPPSFPSIHTSMGGDMREFVAIQEIPHFGLHGYYAVSRDPMPKWTHPTSGLLQRNIEDNNTVFRFKQSSEYAKFDKNEIPHLSPEENDFVTTMASPMDLIAHKNDIKKKEMLVIESRPCWGTNRYIERLIDEAPCVKADLEMDHADALLYSFKDRKMKEVKKESGGTCAISSKRRQVERMVNKRPCVPDPGDEYRFRRPPEEYTCSTKPEEDINVNCTGICLDDDDDSMQRSQTRKPFKSNVQRQGLSRYNEVHEYEYPRRYKRQTSYYGTSRLEQPEIQVERRLSETFTVEEPESGRTYVVNYEQVGRTYTIDNDYPEEADVNHYLNESTNSKLVSTIQKLMICLVGNKRRSMWKTADTSSDQGSSKSRFLSSYCCSRMPSHAIQQENETEIEKF